MRKNNVDKKKVERVLAKNRNFFISRMAILYAAWTLIGFLLHSRSEYFFAFLISTVLSFSLVFVSIVIYGPAIILMKKAARIKNQKQAQDLGVLKYWDVVRKVSEKAGLTFFPRTYLSLCPSMDTRSLGLPLPHLASLIATRDIIQKGDEVFEAVVAHEIGHIKNMDVLMLGMLSYMSIFFLMLAPALMIAAAFGYFVRGFIDPLAIIIPCAIILWRLSGIWQVSMLISVEFGADVFASDLVGSTKPMIIFLENSLMELPDLAEDDRVFLEMRIKVLSSIEKKSWR